MPAEHAPISVRMALDSLEEQCTQVDTTKAALQRHMGIRDNLIRDARQARVPYSMLIRITQLSRDRLVTIVNSPPFEED